MSAEGSSSPVKDYLGFFELNSSYDPDDLEETGKGFRVEYRGALSVFCHSGDEIRSITYLEFAQGQPRGLHYHRVKEEHLCVLYGSLEALFWLPESRGDVARFSLEPGQIVVVKPGCAHAY